MGLFKDTGSIGTPTTCVFEHAHHGMDTVKSGVTVWVTERLKVKYMSKKVDLFKADKAMSERVAAFMRVNVWNITLKARLEKAMKEALIQHDSILSFFMSHKFTLK